MPATERSDLVDNVIDFINVNRERYLDELKAFLAIPSISALPQHAGDVRRCADWCAEEMRRIGLQNVRLVETPGHPVVYGDWLGAPGAPTILFYRPYDVQPVDPLAVRGPSCSRAITRCSRSIRSGCGSRRRSRRRSATARSTRAAPPTTRAR